jgi:dihydrofolate synthase/folylpolyglutamate synthase
VLNPDTPVLQCGTVPYLAVFYGPDLDVSRRPWPMIPLRDQGDFAVWLESLLAETAPRGNDALGLSRALVDALGHPQRHAPAVHIVGTAGKGTVAALLTDRIVAAGISVATHQSPHVHDVRERFLVDGRRPDWSDVLPAAESVAGAVEDVRALQGRAPTFFAVTAALSWELGRRRGVDIFVTEAGIGGRLDATAVLDREDTLTAITAIGLDHTDVLGSTVEEITREKVAVFARRTNAVLGPQPSAVAVRVARDAAREHGTVLDEVAGEFVDWREEAVATADAVVVRLERLLHREIPRTSIRLPPGRYEVISTSDRRVVLDGAHNPLKLAALARVVAEDVAPSCVVAAVGARKNLAGCAAALAALGAAVVATEFGSSGGGPRSWPAADVAAAIREAGATAEERPAVADAARRARELTTAGETILVTGSFFILSESRDALGV